MSFYCYDENGYVGDLASNVGWEDFVSWAEDLDAYEDSAIEEFVAFGITDRIADVKTELEAGVKDDDPDASAGSVAKGLVELAGQAVGFLHLSMEMPDDGSEESHDERG